ncbi:MAG: hypothetical protein ACE5JJ_05225 [Nitrospinota bacterium]
MSPRWKTLLRRLASDRRSGATALARLACRAAEARLQAGIRGSGDLEHFARSLALAQPGMAPLLHLAASLAEGSPAEALERTRAFCARLEAADRALEEAAARFLGAGGCLLTHSASSAVERALLRAARGGARLHVIVTESRPLREGAALARRLARRGVSVRLVVDAAMGLAIEEADAVVVGADALASNGLVHKVGTLPLALLARGRNVPLWSFAQSQKFYPGPFPLERLNPPREASQVERRRPGGLAVDNRYFDLTPLGLLTGAVTEDGPLRRAALRRRLRALRPLALLA